MIKNNHLWIISRYSIIIAFLILVGLTFLNTVHAFDSDGDGISDDSEIEKGTYHDDADTDDDGILDGTEKDWDKDTDGDGIINARDPDSDGDGIYDGTEVGINGSNLHDDTDITAGAAVIDDDNTTTTDPTNWDTDGDGKSDGDEDKNYNGKYEPEFGETDPLFADTDEDGIENSIDPDDDNDSYLDDWENFLGTDPLNSNNTPTDTDDDGKPDGDSGNSQSWMDQDDDNDEYNDSVDDLPLDSAEWADTDDDGIGNNADEDDDGDGMPDEWELQYGLEPLEFNDTLFDNDDDGLTNLEEYLKNTHPKDSDTDNDNIPDGWEVINGLDPLAQSDALEDPDGDGLSNLDEYLNNTILNNPDTDDDNLGDGFELTFSNTDPTNWDTNGNGVGDGLEFIQSQGYLGGMQSLPNDWIGMTISWEDFTIFIKTNSSVLEGKFDKSTKNLTIKVSGPKGTKGATDIDVPKALCQPENISIKFDGNLIKYTLTQNATYYHIHIEYNHSIHELTADFSYSGIEPNGQIDKEPKDEDDFSNYFYIIALIIIVIIIIIILIVVIKTRNNKVTNDIPELPPQQLSTLLEAKRAKGEMTDETYNDIKSKLKKYQNR